MRALLTFFAFIQINMAQASYITYAFGYEQRFDYEVTSGFQCWSTKTPSYTFTLSYGGTFERIPKIIITDAYYGLESTSPGEFKFNLPSTTLTNFQMTIDCPQVNRFYFIRFNWTAIDDDRIEVINVFNVDMRNVASQTYLFQHVNTNALQGFITLTSFGFNGNINISVDINTITQNDVIVSFSTSNNNLLSLGYQIVLGTSQAFNQSSLIISHITSSSFYQSGTLTKPNGQKLITPISGFNFPTANVQNYRIRRIYSESSTTIVYDFENWDGSYQDLSHKQVWLRLPITQQFTPLLLQKMRAMKKDNPWVVTQDIMKLTIVELNQSFQFSSDSKSISLNKGVQILNMIIYFKCGYWQKIQGQILKCVDCLIQLLTVNQICYRHMNEAAYYIKFVQSDSVYQKLQVDVTSSGFTITQTVINQKSQLFTLLSFQISDQ